ncbi:hypothetical protein EE612_052894 [Oryza sativa]|nr:hypothetical protein EE612_052894 [Oryza sativa]
MRTQRSYLCKVLLMVLALICTPAHCLGTRRESRSSRCNW